MLKIHWTYFIDDDIESIIGVSNAAVSSADSPPAYGEVVCDNFDPPAYNAETRSWKILFELCDFEVLSNQKVNKYVVLRIQEKFLKIKAIWSFIGSSMNWQISFTFCYQNSD